MKENYEPKYLQIRLKNDHLLIFTNIFKFDTNSVHHKKRDRSNCVTYTIHLITLYLNLIYLYHTSYYFIS